MEGYTRLFSLIILAVSIASCSGESDSTKQEKEALDSKKSSIQVNNENQKSSQNVKVEKPVKIKSEWSLADLSFENGMKWKANPETSQAIESMDDAMDVFLLTEDHSIEEYHEFSVLLGEQYQNIFKVCKMSGAAHDELHKMLVKMNFFIQKMSSEDLNEIKRGCDQLHKQLHLYNVYFE